MTACPEWPCAWGLVQSLGVTISPKQTEPVGGAGTDMAAASAAHYRMRIRSSLNHNL